MNTNPASKFLFRMFYWLIIALAGISINACAVQSESNTYDIALPQTTATVTSASNTQNNKTNDCKSSAEIEAIQPSSKSQISDLKRAVLGRNIKSLKKLLQQNVDVEEKDQYESTVLFYAVSPSVGDVNLSPPGVAESAVKREMGQRKMRQDEQAQIEMTRELLGHGANTNQKNIYGETPVLRAAGFGYPAAHAVEILTMLIEHQADVNAQDVRGLTALMEAARNGKPEVVKFLLDHGANAELTNCAGEKALTIAQKYKYQDVIRMLQNAK